MHPSNREGLDTGDRSGKLHIHDFGRFRTLDLGRLGGGYQTVPSAGTLPLS